jgi:predicted DCC family thiol-disulfide oxidoreductase YuxK
VTGVPAVTVLYDDRCALCTTLVRRLGSREGVSLAPIRSARGAELLRDLPPAVRDTSLHVLEADGTRRSGAEALPGLARRLRGGRAAAWLLERFPGTAARAYDLVARNRMRLSRPFAAAQKRVGSRR